MKQTGASSDYAVYVVREDGDGDLVALFPSDSGRDHYCEANEQDESLAYHLAHELAASIEHDSGEIAAVRDGPSIEGFPSVLEFTCAFCGKIGAPCLWNVAGSRIIHLCWECFAKIDS